MPKLNKFIFTICHDPNILYFLVLGKIIYSSADESYVHLINLVFKNKSKSRFNLLALKNSSKSKSELFI